MTLTVQDSVRFPGGEALIQQVMREVRMLGEESLCEDRGLCGLRAGGAVCVDRITHDERCHFVFPYEAGKRLEVRAERCAMDGEKRLRGEVEGIRQGKANTTIADVERENAAGDHKWSVRFPPGRFSYTRGEGV